MRRLGSFGTRRVIAFAALAAALALLAGAAKVSQAATTSGGVIEASAVVLNDPSQGKILGQPTPGENIGYTFSLHNGSTNSFNHVVADASIGDGTTSYGSVVYVHTDDPNLVCSPYGSPASPSGSRTLHCTENQIASDAITSVTVIFNTHHSPEAAPGDPIVPSFTGTYASESQNPNNKRTPSKTFTLDPATDPGLNGYVRNYAGAGVALDQSLALEDNDLAVTQTNGRQSKLSMPTAFLNGIPFAGVSLENTISDPPPGCSTCSHLSVKTTIPLAASFGTDGPFLDNNAALRPYEWNIVIPAALLRNGFQPKILWHTTSDTDTSGFQIPSCSVVPNPLTSGPGICFDSYDFDKKKLNVLAHGFAVINGSTYAGS